MGSRFTVAAPLTLALVVIALVAHAAPAAADEELSPAARGHLDRGVAYFGDKDYEAAITEFKAGYEIDPKPAFLYAWAQAERLSGDCASAVPLYERFIESEPDAERQEAAKKNLERCRTALGPEPAVPPPSPPTAPDPPPAVEPATSIPPAPMAEPQPPAEPRPPRAKPTPWYLDPVGGVLLGSGAVIAGVGAAFYLSSVSEEDAAREAETGEASGTYADHQSHIDTAERRRTIGVAGLGLGSALVAGGIVTYLLRARKNRQRVGLYLTPHAGRSLLLVQVLSVRRIMASSLPTRWCTALGLSLAGCTLDPIPFQCDADSECRLGDEQGVCEFTGYCSFHDSECESQRRYGEHAPEALREQCVELCIEQISAGAAHTCARKKSGRVVCWGAAADGRLGNRQPGGVAPGAVDVDPIVSGAVELSVGWSHSCVVQDPGGSVWCWGSNESLRLGVMGGSGGPVEVTALEGVGAPFTQVSAGDAHTCAVSTVGVGCWGENDDGQLGRGTTSMAEGPGFIDADSGVREVAAGTEHTCGHTIIGTVHCWGDNAFEQAGVPRIVADLPTPGPPVGDLRAAQLALGRIHSCALTVDAAVACWGSNTIGQLAQPDVTAAPTSTPVVIDLPAPVRQIAAGAIHTCALSADGFVDCWGSNEFGQIGANALQAPIVTGPTRVDLPGPAVEIAAGERHNCARLADGTIACWGANDAGQLGNGETSLEAVLDADPTVTRSIACP